MEKSIIKRLGPIYKCDHEKNTSCPKTLCQDECFFTRDKQFSVDGVAYELITYSDATSEFVPMKEGEPND